MRLLRRTILGGLASVPLLRVPGLAANVPLGPSPVTPSVQPRPDSTGKLEIALISRLGDERSGFPRAVAHRLWEDERGHELRLRAVWSWAPLTWQAYGFVLYANRRPISSGLLDAAPMSIVTASLVQLDITLAFN